tara:strand:+ start:200 stop:661 length:462 start_codon:yes stop_codon:yes gene_type:complete
MSIENRFENEDFNNEDFGENSEFNYNWGSHNLEGDVEFYVDFDYEGLDEIKFLDDFNNSNYLNEKKEFENIVENGLEYVRNYIKTVDKFVEKKPYFAFKELHKVQRELNEIINMPFEKYGMVNERISRDLMELSNDIDYLRYVAYGKLEWDVN